MTPPLYEVRDLVCSYQGKKVLGIERLDIAADGPTAFVGHNGSGKSTLFRALAFLLKPESGSLTFLGRPTEGHEELLRRDVTMLLQDPYLLRRSVFENVAYGLRARGERRGIEDRVAEVLEMVGLSADFAGREWYQLSGGESRRVTLASRLVLRTKALLLDEPTANVDEENGFLIAEAVKNAWLRWGVVPLVASHDLPWLDEVTDRRVHMKRGRIVEAEVETDFLL
ncbi:MAG TPA: ABC transporter ATP-binding protein [Synergistaceae bacterium]|nr:ABC transporter ATP-binding protein [Synergistaceae bacterium]